MKLRKLEIKTMTSLVMVLSVLMYLGCSTHLARLGTSSIPPPPVIAASLVSYPVIQSLSPSKVVAKSPAFNLKVMGARFKPSAVVLWNKSPRTTKYQDSGHLVAAIYKTDVAQVKLVPVQVSQGSSQSAPVTITIAPAPLVVPCKDGVYNQPYVCQFSNTTGITGILTWSLIGAPAGMTIDSTGKVSWLLPTVGTYKFQAVISNGTVAVTSPVVTARL